MRSRTFDRLTDQPTVLNQSTDAAFLYKLRRFGFAILDDVADFAFGEAPPAES
jgi:hypothetical protein